MRGVLKPAAAPGVAFSAELPEPRVGPGEVLVEIEAASLCGTDREVAGWSASARAFGIAPPVVLGHEAAGRIVELGPDVADLTVGTRVALESHVACGRCHPCRTGSAHTCGRTRVLGLHIDGVFAERVAVPAEICVPVGADVGPETAALLEACGVGMHAVQRSGMAVAGASVLVSGCGPVGLFTAELARTLGALRVVAVEPNPFRRRQAESRGITAVTPDVDVVALGRELTGERGGFDVAFEASGAPGTVPPLLAALRHEGTLVTVGHPGALTEMDVAAHVNKRGVTVRGVYGRRLWDTWTEVVALLESGRLELDWIVTHRLDLAEVDHAVDLLTGDAGKVLLFP